MMERTRDSLQISLLDLHDANLPTPETRIEDDIETSFYYPENRLPPSLMHKRAPKSYNKNPPPKLDIDIDRIKKQLTDRFNIELDGLRKENLILKKINKEQEVDFDLKFNKLISDQKKGN